MSNGSVGTGGAQGGLVTVKLSVMMFLQFFLWGAWFVTLGPYMNAIGFGSGIANAYSTAPIAAILSPLFLGIVADRYFSSQVVMGMLHMLGGVLLIAAPFVAAGGEGNVWAFNGVLLAHMLCYMPTLGLSNTVAFNAMHTPEKQFPLVRVWGTIGWIVAGFGVGMLAQRMAITDGLSNVDAERARAAVPVFFYVAGASGILLGLFSFALPNTPPPMRGQKASIGSVLGFDAIALMKDRSFAVFIVCSMLICIPLAAYYAFAASFATEAGVQNVPIKMTFGQMSEILFMLVMPLCFMRLGVKWMLAVGMLAWVLRYALFGMAWAGPEGQHIMWMILGGIVLHGICYDFFFVTGQIYTEQTAPKAIRAQAQGFLVLVTQGVGMLIGNQLFGRLVAAFTTDGVTDWQKVWMAPAGFALLVLLAFVVLFRGQGKPSGQSD